MSGRYEISDILAQDGEGIVFRATDRDSGREVALRRFFPFGSSGGGLQSEERGAYEIAVQRLGAISHPSLRGVIDGGTDPVDGIPFLVTEWIPGRTLTSLLEEGPLDTGYVRSLLDKAIEASQILSAAFSEEAVWVETLADSIIVGDPDSGRPLTFWISPLRWLGDAGARRGLRPLLQLAEEVTGWKGRMIPEGAGDGLGDWVQALRADPDSWSLGAARQALQHGPPPPATPVTRPLQTSLLRQNPAVSPPAPAPLPVRHKPTLWPWITAGLLALAAAGLFVLQSRRPPAAGPGASAVSEPPPAATPGSPPAEDRPAAPLETLRPPPVVVPQATPAAASAIERRAEELARQAGQSTLLFPGQEATLQGVIVSSVQSSSGVTTYIQFKLENEPGTRWAGFRSADWPDHELEHLKPLRGRQARFRGTLRTENSVRRQYLAMSSPADFTLIDAPPEEAGEN